MDMEVAAVAVVRVQVPDRDTGGWEIVGEEIAHVTSKHGAPGEQRRFSRDRWSEYTVWRLASGRYALLSGSYSTVYHTEPTSCRTTGGGFRGEVFPVGELPDDVQPCWVCNPPEPEDLPESEPIRFEVPRQQLRMFDTPEDMIRSLTRHTKHSGSEVTGVSRPVAALLEKLRASSPDFASVQMPMQRIS